MLRWDRVYSEAELYKAAVRLYTKPLFLWRKALTASTDGRNFYDFARRGIGNIDAVHRRLGRREFLFRPGLALTRRFNGKTRVLHIEPWEERLVDQLLYRLLNARLAGWFSPDAYAYRPAPLGVDRCQREVARALRSPSAPLYVVKRDVAEYFASIDHGVLLAQLAALVEPGDYLMALLEQRIRYAVDHKGRVQLADRGIPFGTATACALANIHLTGLDRALASIPGLSYFRYGDDMLAVSHDRDAALMAAGTIARELATLGLRSKPTHELDLVFATCPATDRAFVWAPRLRHLGLEFRPDGQTRLSRDKARKVRNLFRYAFRRWRAALARAAEVPARARLAISIARRVLDQGVRNVAIIDYYLKHVDDETQLRLLDRWLAEEVVSLALAHGHKKGSFRTLSFARLREMGLPSLVHRRRLIRHGHLESPFFIWRNRHTTRVPGGTAVRSPRRKPRGAFFPRPEAAAEPNLVEERGRLSMGVIEDCHAEARQSFR